MLAQFENHHVRHLNPLGYSNFVPVTSFKKMQNIKALNQRLLTSRSVLLSVANFKQTRFYSSSHDKVKPFAIPFSVLKEPHHSSLESFRNNIKHMKGVNLLLDDHEKFMDTIIAETTHMDSKKMNRNKLPTIYPFHHQHVSGEVNQGKPRLVVCVLGWLGADWKHLDKFVNWYDYCNIETLSTIPPMLSTVSPNHTRKVCDEYVAELEHKFFQEKDDVQLIFHVLSGNGAHMFSRLLENEKFVRTMVPRIKGLIVDSAPPMYNYQRFTQGFVGAIKTGILGSKLNRGTTQNAVADTSEFYKHWLLTPILTTAFKILFHQFGAKERFERLEDLLVKHTKSIPKLFIYSHGDVLVPFSDIDYYLSKHFVEERLERIAVEEEEAKDDSSDEEEGLDEWMYDIEDNKKLLLLDELVFNDSDHVYHFKVHPRAYSEKVLRFIRKASLHHHLQSPTTASDE